MNTKIEEIDGKYVATLVGEMDTMAATEAEEVLKPLYTSDGKDVVIDCKDLSTSLPAACAFCSAS